MRKICRQITFVLVSVFSCICTDLNAQDFFNQSEILIENEIARPIDLQTADLNGDGLGDIIVASSARNGIYWLRNEGANAFSSPLLISLYADGINDIETSDLDQDGDIDIVSSSEEDGKIAWYENQGEGTFATQQIVGYHSDASSVAVGDVNNDGWPDIFCTAGIVTFGTNTSRIHQYTNLGGAVFDDVQSDYGASSNPSIYILDYSGDGWNDLINMSGSRLELILNNGSGELDGPLLSLSSYEDKLAIDFGDIDNDGDLDVVGFVEPLGEENRIIWYRNDGNAQYNTFEVMVATDIGNTPAGVDVDLALADLNGNGFLDIAFTGLHYQGVAWIENLDGNSFADPVLISDQRDFSDLIKIADLNNDGLPDLVTASDHSSDVRLHTNNSETLFSELTLVDQFIKPFDHKWADINNDGLVDLLVGNRQLYWYEQNDDGKLKTPRIIPAELEFTIDFAIADIDQNGFVDLIVSNQGSLYSMLNTNGSFGEANLFFDTPYIAGDFILADLDNDEFPDLIWRNTSSLSWMRNDQSGNFEAPISFDDTAYVKCFVIEDMNADGLMDLIIVKSQELFILKQKEDYSFERITIELAPVPSIASVKLDVADINLDGINDIIMDQNSVNEVWYFEGTGDFTYTKYETEFQSIDDKVNPRLADFDVDGDPDYLGFGETTILHRNNTANSSFEQIPLNPILNGLNKSIVDYDADNDPDIIYYNDFQIAWYENNPSLVQPTFEVVSENCWMDTVSLHNSTLAGFSNCSFNWNFGDGNSSNEIHPEHIYESGGSYVISLEFCCNQDCLITIDTIAVRRTDHFIPITGFVNTPISFEDNSSGFTSRSWVFGDGNVSTLPNPTHTYENAGTYSVEFFLTDSTLVNCTYHTIETLVIEGNTFAIEPVRDSINLYPNPVESGQKLFLTQPMMVSNYQIIDANSRIIQEHNESLLLKNLDLKDLGPGCYFLRLETKDGVVSKKFVVLD